MQALVSLLTFNFYFKMKRTLLLLFVMVGMSHLTFAQKDIPAAKAGVVYGKKVTAKKAIGVPELTAKLASEGEYIGKVEGTVVEVCKKKGCFMKVARENGDPIMVKFTDYAYFMPQDIVGKKVVLAGKATLKETSVEDLQHFAQDAGKSKEEIAAITQPKKDIEIVADGVLVVK